MWLSWGFDNKVKIMNNLEEEMSREFNIGLNILIIQTYEIVILKFPIIITYSVIKHHFDLTYNVFFVSVAERFLQLCQK